jgi:D-alanyl-D-alanine carboxypeptidase
MNNKFFLILIIILLLITSHLRANSSNFKVINLDNLQNPSLKDKFIGEIKNEKYNGIGKYIFRVGESDEVHYIGEFKNNLYDGFGIYTFTNKDENICGLWKKGKHKDIIYTHQKRKNDIGNKRDILKGDFNSYGVYYFVNGDYIVGQFNDHEINGQARRYKANGKIYDQGIYSKNKLITKKIVSASIINKARQSEKKGIANCRNAEIIVKKYNNNSNINSVTKKNNSSNQKFVNSLIGNFEGELIYDDGSRLKIFTKIYQNNSGILKGTYTFRDFDKSKINGTLYDFQISGGWIDAKWKDKYGTGWLKVNYRNSNFEGSFGLTKNGKYTSLGKWNGKKVSLDSNNSKYIFCSDKYGVYKYLKAGNCYDGQTKVSEEQFLQKATYCKKKNGKIYLSDFNYCKSNEKVTNQFQYNKYINNLSNQSGIQNKYIDKIDFILNKLIYLENKIKADTKEIASIEKSNSLKNFKDIEANYNKQVGSIQKEINILEKEIKSLKVGNLIKNNIENNFDKLSAKSFIVLRLIVEYKYQYDLYLENKKDNTFTKISTSADQAIIINYDNDEILYEKNADFEFAPASMTKIMTAYVVFDRLKNTSLSIKNLCRISAKAYKIGGSRSFLEIDDAVSINDLLKGLIVQSGNDSAIALAECMSGTEFDFAKLMNIYAKRLGMNNSNFVNASGWPVYDHYSTVRDLAILSKAIINKFPYLYNFFSISEFTYNEIKQPNRNKLLNLVQGVDGLKTGFTKESGWGVATSAKRQNKRIILVINGADSSRSRLSEAEKLVNWAFDYISSSSNNISIKKIEEKNIDGNIEGVYYTTANANFRDKPSASNSNVISTISKGSAVEVLRLVNENDDWAQIKYNNQIGYIYLPLLTKTEPEFKSIDNLDVFLAEDMMQLALQNISKKNFIEAKNILTEVINKYPETPLTGSAFFWLGRIYEFEENYRDAAITYGEGAQKFPNSIKAVEMLYNLSQVLAKLNKLPEACKIISLLNVKYKNNKFITMAEESANKLNCKEREKSDINKIEEPLSEQEQALVNVYYSELKKIYDLFDMKLITDYVYKSRKELIINQIINLNLKNISHFLIQLVEEQLITTEEFEFLNKNNASLELKQDEKKVETNNENKNFNFSELLDELLDDNINNKETKTANLEVTISEMDLVIQQLRSCFNPRAGTQIIGNEMVKIRAEVDRNAYVRKDTVQIIDTNISKSNPYYEPITESAVATLYNPLCSKLKLPLDKYESWKDLTITIDYSWIKN